MQIPIINGIYTNSESDFRVAYPRNLVPVPQDSGISSGYLRPADGIQFFTDGIGLDRAGINWNGIMYRVSGNRLIRVFEDGTVEELGAITGNDQATIDYSFDRLAISADNKLYYYNDIFGLQQVIDSDLQDVKHFIWIDGYFMTTDGEFLIVTDLNDPFSVNPLRYGSSEVDPDPILALLKIRNEATALNRYSIETFENVGGTGFPFSRIEGAQVQKGVVGTKACCEYIEAIAFMGSGRNESISVYLGGGGRTTKLATREIDQIISKYTEEQLSTVQLEARTHEGLQHLYIHLPNQTLVYDAATSQVVGQPVWFTKDSSKVPDVISRYRGRNVTYCYSKWFVGDTETSAIGTLEQTTGEHWGSKTNWEFSTSIVYNNGVGLLFYELELVALTGRTTLGASPTVATSYTNDGVTWSQPKYRRVGTTGDRDKRIMWLNQGSMRHWRAQRFQGTSECRLSTARLEAKVEQLGV